MTGLYMETKAFRRYGLTEGQRARTVQSGMMSSCAWLSINILELLGMVMNVCVMMMLRGDEGDRMSLPLGHSG